MADDLDLDVEEEKGKGGGGAMKWIIIGVAGLVLFGGALFATLYFAGFIGGEEEEVAAADDGGKKAEEAKAKTKAPLIYQPLEPPFVVNFSADSDVRFMQVTIQVADRDPAVIERVKEHSPAIRNALVMLFSSQDPEALNTREGKERLRKEALEEVRKALKEQTGSGQLENLFFTSFVMQ